jgi:phytoene synthase
MSEGLAEAIGQLSEMAAGHLAKAEVAIATLPSQLRSVFAPVALLKTQYKRLDLETPFQRGSDLADWRKIALLSWWKLTST